MNWLKHAQESNLGVCTSHAAVAGCCFLLVLGCLCNRDGHWGVALVVYDAYGDMSSSRRHHICHPFFIKIYYLLLLLILLFPFISLLLIIIAIILYLLFDNNAELFT